MIDVREPDEVVQGSIPSAVNLPLSVLPNALHLPPEEFKEKFGFEKPRQDQELTFYCRSGKRSTTAADVAKRNGYTKCACHSLLVSYFLTDSVAFSTTRALGWTGLSGKGRDLRLLSIIMCSFSIYIASSCLNCAFVTLCHTAGRRFVFVT